MDQNQADLSAQDANPLQKVSAYIYSYLQHLVHILPSYLRDIDYFLKKHAQLPLPLYKNSILATMVCFTQVLGELLQVFKNSHGGNIKYHTNVKIL